MTSTSPSFGTGRSISPMYSADDGPTPPSIWTARIMRDPQAGELVKARNWADGSDPGAAADANTGRWVAERNDGRSSALVGRATRVMLERETASVDLML